MDVVLTVFIVNLEQVFALQLIINIYQAANYLFKVNRNMRTRCEMC